MPFDREIADRLAPHFADEPGAEESRLFGGFGFTINGNMCAGIHTRQVMIRVGKETAQQIIGDPGVLPMDLTGRVMKAWATLDREAVDDPERLKSYLDLAKTFVRTLPPK